MRPERADQCSARSGTIAFLEGDRAERLPPQRCRASVPSEVVGPLLQEQLPELDARARSVRRANTRMTELAVSDLGDRGDGQLFGDAKPPLDVLEREVPLVEPGYAFLREDHRALVGCSIVEGLVADETLRC